jgi:hypothetical protein
VTTYVAQALVEPVPGEGGENRRSLKKGRDRDRVGWIAGELGLQDRQEIVHQLEAVGVPYVGEVREGRPLTLPAKQALPRGGAYVRVGVLCEAP